MSATRVAISRFGRPSCFRPNATFCSTVMCGNSAYDWNIMLTGRSYGGMPVMSTPSIEMRAGGRLLEPGQHAQQRGLAAARAAEQAEQLAAIDLQRDVVDGDELAELLGDAARC